MTEIQAVYQDTTGYRAVLRGLLGSTVTWRGRVVECREDG